MLKTSSNKSSSNTRYKCSNHQLLTLDVKRKINRFFNKTEYPELYEYLNYFLNFKKDTHSNFCTYWDNKLNRISSIYFTDQITGLTLCFIHNRYDVKTKQTLRTKCLQHYAKSIGKSTSEISTFI